MQMRTRTADSAQDVINARQLYARADLVRVYANCEIYPPEAVVLQRYHAELANRPVLELGCGAGRLASHLQRLTAGYVGLDISPYMIDYCRQQMPQLRFEEGDMRELTRFADASFDAVFGIFNLFDAVCHADRLRILAEIRRVLSRDGLLVFSSHNRNYAHAIDAPRMEWTSNPRRLLRSLLDYFHSCINHRRIRVHQRYEADYSLLNDSGHNFSVLHYYISREAQAAQLAAAGYRLLECLDESGRSLEPTADDSAYASIHYVARASQDGV